MCIDLNNIKIKYIKEEEFLSYLDWLTRFKNPINNLIRVSEKIVVKNLLVPKLNINKTAQLSFFKKIEIAQYIWNKSLENLINKAEFSSSKLKDFLIFEELATFNTNYLIEQIKTLEFEKKIKTNDYAKIRKELFFQIDELTEFFDKKLTEKPLFLKRLINKKNSKLTKEELLENKNDFASIKLLFLVEGVTEEKLLPVFAEKENFSFNKNGIKLKAVGGKTHILKYYSDIRKLLKIPVLILLDADGTDILDKLTSILEDKDEIYLIEKGEIEDILPHELILKTINHYYEMQGSITPEDLSENQPMTKILYNIYKEKGFGEFQKAKFAEILKNNINSSTDVSREIKKIIDIIRNK